MKRASALPLGLFALLLLGCDGAPPSTSMVANSGAADFTASSGQVATVRTYRVSYYAASRFAEQASFGPTPALVEELRTKGFEQWIDEQLALPVAPIDPMRVVLDWNAYLGAGIAKSTDALRAELMKVYLTAPDQLRWRVAYSLQQYWVISMIRVEPAPLVYWNNDLYRLALDNYANLIRDVSTSAPMGFYLDNAQNRPKSDACPSCAPNENYARELMQLFTLGVVKLNPDGSTVRDVKGQTVETYSQRDVEELARALTGWSYHPDKQPDTPRNWGNWPKRMVPDTSPTSHDLGSKQVLGRTFPASQGQRKDLEDVVALLMQHPNIAPFVALRMIQHLVMSDPSPAYISRVGAVFRNNGRGVAGDMRAVIKAVLLDPDARRGDDPGRPVASDGKLREPLLHWTGMLRGLGCRNAPIDPWSKQPRATNTQQPFMQSSVFGFYAPTDRAPGSNLLAPEQRMLNSAAFFERLWQLNYYYIYNGGAEGRQALADASCNMAEFIAAYRRSTADLANLVAQRYLRGAMPRDLTLLLLDIDKQWRTAAHMREDEIVAKLIEFALIGAAYGAKT